jgi:hypothetical protein
MINTDNTQNSEMQDHDDNVQQHPDEDGGFYLHDFLKISDPETGEIITQGRA